MELYDFDEEVKTLMNDWERATVVEQRQPSPVKRGVTKLIARVSSLMLLLVALFAFIVIPTILLKVLWLGFSWGISY